MDWIPTLGIVLLAWLLGDILRPVLHPLFRAGAKLYAPPHGSIALALTWIAAIALTLWAFGRGGSTPDLAIAVAVLSIPLALVATIAWRDARQVARDRAKPRMPQS